jgi:hypothetical protein
MTETLLARRAKVLMTWLNATNPVVNVSLTAQGALSFENAAEEAGMEKAAERYTVQWARFENASSTLTAVGELQTSTTRTAQAPKELLSADYVAATIRAYHPDQPAWQHPVIAYFRRAPDASWSLVGLERNP